MVGTDNADSIRGADGNDLIFGLGGDDTLIGDHGSDTIWGGLGNDLILSLNLRQSSSEPDASRNVLYGEEGDDVLAGAIFSDTLSGGDGADILIGGLGQDLLLGDAGNDILGDQIYGSGYEAYTGACTMDGGDGDDSLNGGHLDTLIGGGGNDRLILQDESRFRPAPTFTADGGDGDDVITIRDSGVVDGGAGVDWIAVRAGNVHHLDFDIDLSESAAGTPQNLNGGSFVNIEAMSFEASVGDDSLTGYNFADRLFGSLGDDVLNGGRGADSIDGGEGDDLLVGGASADTLLGGGGSDTLRGGRGSDSIDGVDGIDLLDLSQSKTGVTVDLITHVATGSDGEVDSVLGVEDVLTGAFDDFIVGSRDANVIRAGDGADTIEGAHGDDRLSGGGGGDAFLYLRLGDSRGADCDLITDLTGDDLIDLSRIDADTTQGGNQAFVRVESLTGHAGEMSIKYRADGDITVVRGDVNGDGKPDFVLHLVGDQTVFDHYVF
jgi:Ca2+-binding RTX toxin-like protein